MWVGITPPPRIPNVAAQLCVDLAERGPNGFGVVTSGLQEKWEVKESMSEDAEPSLHKQEWARWTKNLSASKRGLHIQKDRNLMPRQHYPRWKFGNTARQ